MTRVALLSDLHFGLHDPDLLSALARDVQAATPDVVAGAGDLTNRGRPAEFEAAAVFLQSLCLPVVAVPDNHDIPGVHPMRLLDPFREWRRTFGAKTEPVWSEGRTALLGFNTVCRISGRLDWSAGVTDRAQLRRLGCRAARFPGRRLLVLAHHPFRHPPQDRLRAALGGASAAVATFSALGVSAVLSGHLHRPATLPAKDAPDLILAGAALCRRRPRGQPNAWILVQVGPDGVAATHRAWSNGRFAPWPPGGEEG